MNTSYYPLLREAKVVNSTDPKKLGRIQLKVLPELAEIPNNDCPWCLPTSGGVHGKSFGLPLKDQLVSCIVWNKFWNEISFFPFVITEPTKHLFDDWVKNQRSNITDMKDNPEEEHLVVEQYDDDFNTFHDSKNNQHGFLHSSGTYGLVKKDGSAYIQSVKKCVFHNKTSDLIIEINSENGSISLKTKGDVKVESSGALNIKSNGPCNIESTAMTTVKGSSMVVIDAPMLKFSGSKSMGKVTPSGSGVCCAINKCPATALPHTG